MPSLKSIGEEDHFIRARYDNQRGSETRRNTAHRATMALREQLRKQLNSTQSHLVVAGINGITSRFDRLQRWCQQVEEEDGQPFLMIYIIDSKEPDSDGTWQYHSLSEKKSFAFIWSTDVIDFQDDDSYVFPDVTKLKEGLR